MNTAGVSFHQSGANAGHQTLSQLLKVAHSIKDMGAKEGGKSAELTNEVTRFLKQIQHFDHNNGGRPLLDMARSFQSVLDQMDPEFLTELFKELDDFRHAKKNKFSQMVRSTLSASYLTARQNLSSIQQKYGVVTAVSQHHVRGTVEVRVKDLSSIFLEQLDSEVIELKVRELLDKVPFFESDVIELVALMSSLGLSASPNLINAVKAKLSDFLMVQIMSATDMQDILRITELLQDITDSPIGQELLSEDILEMLLLKTDEISADINESSLDPDVDAGPALSVSPLAKQSVDQSSKPAMPSEAPVFSLAALQRRWHHVKQQVEAPRRAEDRRVEAIQKSTSADHELRGRAVMQEPFSQRAVQGMLDVFEAYFQHQMESQLDKL